jgi:hypothetical protein
MTFNHTPKYFAAVLLICGMASTIAHAAPQTLFPTDLTSTGDCLSDTLSAPMNTMQTQGDMTFCTDGNKGDAEAIHNCIRNSATKTEVVFFSDKCGSEGENVAFLSVNGKEYRVQRHTKPTEQPAYFTGTYEGDGAKIVIQTGTVIPDETIYDDSDLKNVLIRVPVKIIIGKNEQSFDAILSHMQAPP